MIEPSIDELMDPKKKLNIESKFALISMISKRSKQLNNGEPPLITTNDLKAVTIALKEINQGKIMPLRKKP